MTRVNDEANARWYKQALTPFTKETRPADNALRVTKSEAGQVVQLNTYPGARTRPDEKDDSLQDARKYQLIWSYESGDPTVEAPFLFIAEMDPGEDEDDFNAWYNEEHVPMVAKMPGYIRCGRYRIMPDEAAARPAPKYVTIHEVQDLDGFNGDEARASGATEWTIKHMAQVKNFKMTGWEVARE